MKSVYPFSTSKRAAKSRSGRKLAALGVEYLFMGNGSRNQWQMEQGNHDDFRYVSINVLKIAAKPDKRSGRYRHN